jgi:hypothetical protein
LWHSSHDARSVSVLLGLKLTSVGIGCAAPEAEKPLLTRGADATGRYLTIVNVS